MAGGTCTWRVPSVPWWQLDKDTRRIHSMNVWCSMTGWKLGIFWEGQARPPRIISAHGCNGPGQAKQGNRIGLVRHDGRHRTKGLSLRPAARPRRNRWCRGDMLYGGDGRTGRGRGPGDDDGSSIADSSRGFLSHKGMERGRRAGHRPIRTVSSASAEPRAAVFVCRKSHLPTTVSCAS